MDFVSDSDTSTRSPSLSQRLNDDGDTANQPNTETQVNETATTSQPASQPLKLPTKRFRGRTQCHSQAKQKAKGKKPRVDKDLFGNPDGDEAVKLATYIGLISRQLIPCSGGTWRNVDDVTRQRIWESVSQAYTLADDMFKPVMTGAKNAFKDWRYTLTHDFLYAREGMDEMYHAPKKQYPQITDEQWAEFVRQRLDPKFRELSMKQKERGDKNKYRPRTGRSGMRGVRAKLAKEGVIDPDRHVVWKASRKDVEGNVSDVPTQEFFQIIDDVGSQVAEGKICLGEREDILQRAFNKPPPPGRLVTGGRNATMGMYFKTHQKSDNAEVFRLTRELEAARHKELALQAENDRLRETVVVQSVHIKTFEDIHREQNRSRKSINV